MSIHDGFLDLAATSIDFKLDDYDRAELDRHLASCDQCRRTAEAFREDAAVMAVAPTTRLSPARAEAILAAALRPEPGRSPLRLVAIAALVAVLGVAAVAAGLEIARRLDDGSVAGLPSPGNSAGPGGSSLPSADASTPPDSSGPRSSHTPFPIGSPDAAALPIRGDQDIASVLMAPGQDEDLYVTIPRGRGTVLARLDSRLRPAAGWPLVIPGASGCSLLLVARDGSVRVVCYADDLVAETGDPPVRAFAFDAAGGAMPGWPVELPCCFTGRMVGDQMTMFTVRRDDPDDPDGVGRIVTVGADGEVRPGAETPLTFECCLDTWAVGPDGIAYGTTHDFAGSSVTSLLTAVGPAGVPEGFPVGIEDNTSRPAFDEGGRLRVNVGSPVAGPAQTLVFDASGRPIAVSDELDIVPSSEWSGAGADFTGAPFAASDGTTFVIGERRERSSGTTALGLSATGQLLPGWPYRSDLAYQSAERCGESDTGCGGFRVDPAIGPNNVLYLVHAAANASSGGSLVAIGTDGRVIDGWPVGLKRPGSAFWSVVVASDGTAFPLAVEPEPNGGFSATILSIAPDSTVEHNLTIVEP